MVLRVLGILNYFINISSLCACAGYWMLAKAPGIWQQAASVYLSTHEAMRDFPTRKISRARTVQQLLETDLSTQVVEL
jgi:hypothetical protein